MRIFVGMMVFLAVLHLRLCPMESEQVVVSEATDVSRADTQDQTTLGNVPLFKTLLLSRLSRSSTSTSNADRECVISAQAVLKIAREEDRREEMPSWITYFPKPIEATFLKTLLQDLQLHKFYNL